MNITLVTEHFGSGGLETHLRGFIRCMHGSGHRVSVVTGTGARLDLLRDIFDGRILQVPLPEHLTGGMLLDLARRIAAFCLDQESELLHVHPFATLLVGGLAAVEARLPFVVTLHGPRNMSLQKGDIALEMLSRTVLSTAERIFCVSADLIPEVESIQPFARCSALPNGVNARASAAVSRRSDGDWAIVTRLDANKVVAARQAIDALGGLPGKNFRLRVFGDGPAREELEAWVAGRSYASRVNFEGFCDPLRPHLEYGYAGAAAMARSLLDVGMLGLPVLLSGYDGIKGLVRRDHMTKLRSANYTGRGLPTIGVSELASQMADLERNLQDYSLRPWIVENADEADIWRGYTEELRELTPPDSEAWVPLVRTLQAHPARAVYCEETLIPLVPQDAARVLRLRIAKRQLAAFLRRVSGQTR